MSSTNASRHLAISSALALALGTRAGALPDDPYFDLQWGLHNTGQEVDHQVGLIGADIHALDAWDVHLGTSSVVVAIVGRGIDPHPEFSDRLLEGHATVGDPYDTLDACPHDTHLAGIIAAATGNGEGIAGLNGRAWLLPVRVLDGCGGSALAAAEGIIWAVDHGADVVLAAVQFPDEVEALAEAVTYAVSHDVVIVAPAGSTGNNIVAYPAAYEGCLAVSATTNRDERSGASNYGPQVDLSAPGSGIWSTWINGGYAYQQPNRDTASASAYVAGVAALVRSYAPQLSAPDVAQVLLESADDLGKSGWDEDFGVGRLNAGRALAIASAPALRFEFVEPPPTSIPPGLSSSLIVRIVDVEESVSPGSTWLSHSIDSGAFGPAPLLPLGDELYAVELPAVECGSTLDYFLGAMGDRGTVVRDPLDAPTNVRSAQAIRHEALFEDNFETDLGWELVLEGGDETRGAWKRVIPAPAKGQAHYDYSADAGSHCYVTGQPTMYPTAIVDVDNGPVRLISPEIALPDLDVEISYGRWFRWSGTGQEDYLTVDFSRNGGDSWTMVEVVASTGAWVTHSFRLSDFPDVEGDQLRIRFSVSDLPDDSLTEAAIDEVHVRAIRCVAVRGDADDNGIIDQFDYARMPGCWVGPAGHFTQAKCDALDFDRNRRVDLVDFQAFQAVFGGP